jgi:hypothetical protein
MEASHSCGFLPTGQDAAPEQELRRQRNSEPLNESSPERCKSPPCAAHRLTSSLRIASRPATQPWRFKVFAPLLVAPAASSMDLGAMIAHSGPIGIFVMFTLIVMSIACWGIIVLKYKHLRIAEQQTRKFLDCFWNAADLDKVYHQAQNLRRSPVAQLFLAGYGELRRAGNDAEGSFAAELGSFENIERALQSPNVRNSSA